MGQAPDRDRRALLVPIGPGLRTPQGRPGGAVLLVRSDARSGAPQIRHGAALGPVAGELAARLVSARTSSDGRDGVMLDVLEAVLAGRVTHDEGALLAAIGRGRRGPTA